ncbi:hypothetical protein V500_05234 [Pseudogymnoascus sp. VKM F-4518 (FW-2643)]|nr:hypothetical protein V500_05234 [Pseudogymnoascus sp. VKM F-4518 (FW-2643)]
MLKENTQRQQRRHEAPHALHRLRQIQPNLRIPRRPTNRQERICSRLQRRKPGADDEHTAAEAAERAFHAGGPEEQAADGEDGEAAHEGDAEAVAAENPAGGGEVAEEVGAKLGSGEAGGFGGGDVELLLEMAVEDVEEAVGVAPEEEEDCDLGVLVNCSPIISGLAVLMIKGDKGWHDAEDFTTKYSAVIKLARLMVVQEAYEQRQEQICAYQSEMTEVEARKEATSYYGLVKKFVGQFTTMTYGGRDPTPMQWIYQTRSYGFKIRYTTPAAGKIHWIRDEVLYHGTRVQMSQLRSMAHGLIGEARDELFGKLMVVTDEGGVPSIDWDNTVDQPSETKVGWSFLDDERNKFGAYKEW